MPQNRLCGSALEARLRREYGRALKVAPVLLPSEWAEGEDGIVLGPSSAIQGPIRFSRTPYMREPLDRFADPSVDRIACCWAAQTGKSTIEFCVLGYVVDQKPGPTMIAYPTETLAKGVSKRRLQPLIQECPSVARHMTGREDDFQLLQYTFDRMSVVLSWAFSATGIRSDPIRWLILDEESAFPPGASDSALKRTSTFWDAKIFSVSTPDNIEDSMWRRVGLKPQSKDLRGEELFDVANWAPQSATTVYWHEVSCPHCGAFIRLEFSRLRWLRDVAIREIDRNGWYECQACDGVIEDGHKPQMLAGGRWTTENPGGRWVAYHLNAMYAPWDSCRFGAIAQRYVVAKKAQDPEVMKRFVTEDLALPYMLAEQGKLIISSKHIAAAAEKVTYRRNTLPAPVVALVTGADVGEHATHWVTLGWAPGSLCYFISWGIMATPQEIEKHLIQATYDHPSGVVMRALAAGMDCRYDRSTVVSIARRMPGFLVACQGEHKVTDPGNVRVVPHYPTSLDRGSDGRKIAGGLMGLRVNTGYFKQFFYGRMARIYDQDCSIFMPTDRDETLERHLQSEHEVTRSRVVKGQKIYEKYWETRPGFAENHYLDATVYALAVSHSLGLHDLDDQSKPDSGLIVPEAESVAQKRCHEPSLKAPNGQKPMAFPRYNW